MLPAPWSRRAPTIRPEAPSWRPGRSLSTFDKPFITAFSDRDPMTGGGQAVFQKKVPGAHRMEHVTIIGAGHFLQEDQPEQICTQLMDFVSMHS